MTEDTAQDASPLRDGEASPTPPEGAATTAATKKTPARRKAAARPKAAQVVEAVETDGAMVKKTVVRTRKPRAKAAAETVSDGAGAPMADGTNVPTGSPARTGAAVPETLSPSTAREALIETKVIAPDTHRVSAERTSQDSGRVPENREPDSRDTMPAPAMAEPRTSVEAPTRPPAGDPGVALSEPMSSPAEAAPGSAPAEQQSNQPAQGQRYEQGQDGVPRGDFQQGRQDRPQQDGRYDRQNRPFDRSQQQGGGRHDNRHDRRDRQYPQGGGQGNDRQQGQFNNDRQQGQYGNDRQGGGQGSNDRQQGQYPNDRQGGGQGSNDRQQGQYGNDRQGGGQFNRRDRNDRFDRGDRNDRGPREPQAASPGSFDEGGQMGADGIVSRPTEAQYGEGIVEVSGKGFGFLREAKRNFVQTPADIFVTPEVCRKYNLRDGQWIKGEVRRSSRGPQLFRLTQLNGEDVDGSTPRSLPNFEELTTINPRKRIKLETAPDRYTTRVMDLMTPVGKGQRGLIVAPPRTGKTTLLQHIGEAVIQNHPEMKLIILLVDERPEEVTEIRRSVPQAEIMASSNDSDLKSHVRIAQLAMERCKRLVEAGQHVFMLLDSITRMARAFNNTTTGNRGTQSGGLAVGALEIPRKIFAAARNTEEAGSLTIMATALIETNSKMDDAIFQEFKGTGNMELVLDRKISDQRVYPAVDIFLSGTRREELLLQGWELDKINVIRRGLAGHKPLEAIERLLSFLKKFPTNAQMLMSLPG